MSATNSKEFINYLSLLRGATSSMGATGSEVIFKLDSGNYLRIGLRSTDSNLWCGLADGKWLEGEVGD